MVLTIIITTIIAMVIYLALWKYCSFLLTKYLKLSKNAHFFVMSVLSLSVILSLPYIFNRSLELYAENNKVHFQLNSSGISQLSNTPLKVPRQVVNVTAYCEKFVNQEGKPINFVSFIGKEAFCGYFYQMQQQDVSMMIPYKLLPNKQAEYWASPDLRIIGQAPNI